MGGSKTICDFFPFSFFQVQVASGSAPGQEIETNLRLASNIHFCEKGFPPNITCCFSNVQCVDDFDDVNDEVILDLNWLLFE